MWVSRCDGGCLGVGESVWVSRCDGGCLGVGESVWVDVSVWVSRCDVSVWVSRCGEWMSPCG